MNLKPNGFLSDHPPLRSESEAREERRAAKHYGKTLESIRQIVAESVKRERNRE